MAFKEMRYILFIHPDDPNPNKPTRFAAVIGPMAKECVRPVQDSLQHTYELSRLDMVVVTGPHTRQGVKINKSDPRFSVKLPVWVYDRHGTPYYTFIVIKISSRYFGEDAEEHAYPFQQRCPHCSTYKSIMQFVRFWEIQKHVNENDKGGGEAFTFYNSTTCLDCAPPDPFILNPHPTIEMENGVEVAYFDIRARIRLFDWKADGSQTERTTFFETTVTVRGKKEWTYELYTFNKVGLRNMDNTNLTKLYMHSQVTGSTELVLQPKVDRVTNKKGGPHKGMHPHDPHAPTASSKTKGRPK